MIGMIQGELLGCWYCSSSYDGKYFLGISIFCWFIKLCICNFCILYCSISITILLKNMDIQQHKEARGGILGSGRVGAGGRAESTHS